MLMLLWWSYCCRWRRKYLCYNDGCCGGRLHRVQVWMRRPPSELVLHVLLLLFVVVVVLVGAAAAAAAAVVVVVVVVAVKELVLMMDRYPCKPRWWQRVVAGMLLPGCFRHF